MKASQTPGSYTLLRLVVSGPGEHVISVSQTDERCYSRHSEYDYSNCRIVVMKIEKDAEMIEDLGLKYIKSAQGWDRESHCEINALE